MFAGTGDQQGMRAPMIGDVDPGLRPSFLRYIKPDAILTMKRDHERKTGTNSLDGSDISELVLSHSDTALAGRVCDCIFFQ